MFWQCCQRPCRCIHCSWARDSRGAAGIGTNVQIQTKLQILTTPLTLRLGVVQSTNRYKSTNTDGGAGTGSGLVSFGWQKRYSLYLLCWYKNYKKKIRTHRGAYWYAARGRSGGFCVSIRTFVHAKQETWVSLFSGVWNCCLGPCRQQLQQSYNIAATEL